jgi:hypothetical protein
LELNAIFIDFIRRFADLHFIVDLGHGHDVPLSMLSFFFTTGFRQFT